MTNAYLECCCDDPTRLVRRWGGRKVETKEKLRKITTILLVLLHLQVKHKTKIIHTTLSYKNRQ